MFIVRNWRRFQHYKDRNPPWIKLHFELLSSESWVLLDDASRVLAVACMLIASRNEGQVPNNPGYLKRVAYLNKPPNFKPLIDCGFLEVASRCKQMLADARPETETETETETEKDQQTSPQNGEDLPPPDETISGTKKNGVPFLEIVGLYHTTLPELPSCAKLTTTRKGNISQRWREDLPDMDSWGRFFDIVRKSDFLMGRVPGSNGKPPFRADLEWLTNASNIVKIIEGKYHRGKA